MACLKELDYYGILGITRSANIVDIKKAYRRLALHFHPDKYDDGENIVGYFAAVGEAYEVLSDPLLKAIYDQYGEDGLKRGVLTPMGWHPPYTYHNQPLCTFNKFFGTDNPYADLLDVYHNPPPLFDFPEGKGIKKKEPPLVKTLELTLEEVFFGCMKKVKVLRRVMSEMGDGTTELKEKILTVDIKPGLPEGTEFAFEGVGNVGASIYPGDLILVTKDKPHDRYKREGNDLLMNHEVCLRDSLVGTILTINTLDGRTLRTAITQVITPDYEKVIDGEGMPFCHDPRRKGDLKISFTINFPEYLPEVSKLMIGKALSKEMSCDSKRPDFANRLIVADKMRRIYGPL